MMCSIQIYKQDNESFMSFLKKMLWITNKHVSIYCFTFQVKLVPSTKGKLPVGLCSHTHDVLIYNVHILSTQTTMCMFYVSSQFLDWGSVRQDRPLAKAQPKAAVPSRYTDSPSTGKDSRERLKKNCKFYGVQWLTVTADARLVC